MISQFASNKKLKSERHAFLTRGDMTLEDLHGVTRSAHEAASENLAIPLTRRSQKLTR